MITPQISLRVEQFATQFWCSMIVLALMSVCPLRALAQDAHSHTVPQQNQEASADQEKNQSALLKLVRESTTRFQNVRAAENEGYRLEFGCVSGDDFGAMGLHYVNDTLVANGGVDATRPRSCSTRRSQTAP